MRLQWNQQFSAKSIKECLHMQYCGVHSGTCNSQCYTCMHSCGDLRKSIAFTVSAVLYQTNVSFTERRFVGESKQFDKCGLRSSSNLPIFIIFITS